ncbi:MAG: CDP-alcohol phosphatidyltransferase family protein [Deltaproteobacteria bacterium]|nr:CDP-alcohol phosphatidyltransferase family protein [Deltaproteobacteria bacterium]
MSRADEPIFGRPLLERLIMLCRRAGIDNFMIEACPEQRNLLQAALGKFRDDPKIRVVDSIRQAIQRPESFAPETLCVRFSGNLVLAQSQLEQALETYLAHQGSPLRISSADHEHGGALAVGPLSQLIDQSVMAVRPDSVPAGSILPFALNGRPVDREEAEVRLARSVRHESVNTDALMARMVDRRFSWRISLRLARTRVTPNQVTIFNTIVGLGCGLMLASVSYWLRLCGALLFLLSITLDGVDGELARLRMLESPFGKRLDVMTDNLVHVAVFTGIAAGCYRLNHSSAYWYVLAILLAGFGACAVSVNHALSQAGDEAHRWISRVERATGRDFAYVVAILALFNQLYLFIWGTAFGTHIFALSLWWMSARRQRSAVADRRARKIIIVGKERL